MKFEKKPYLYVLTNYKHYINCFNISKKLIDSEAKQFSTKDQKAHLYLRDLKLEIRD